MSEPRTHIQFVCASFITDINRVGYRLNFIDFDSNSDSAYRFRFLSIPSFDSNVIK